MVLVKVRQVRALIEREVARSGSLRSARLSRPRWMGWLIPGVSAVVSVVIAVAAVVLLSHRPNARSIVPARERSAIADFAVLRRAQTAADLVPGRVLRTIDHSGLIRIQPRMTRLVATVGGSKVYLVVGTPAQGSARPGPVWSARSGELVGELAVGGGSQPHVDAAPVGELADAVDASVVVARPRSTADASALVAIAPDGVSRVAFVVIDRFGRVLRSVSAPPVTNNAAVILSSIFGLSRSIPARDRPLSEKVEWFAQDGAVIPTSDTALTRATAVGMNAARGQLLRQAQRQGYRAPAAFLARFAVFEIHSRAGIRTREGLTISQPDPQSIPIGVLNTVGARIDLTSVRKITKGAVTMWVAAQAGGDPASEAICVTVIKSEPGVGGYGASGGCGGQGAGESSTGANGTIIYEVVPTTTKTVSILTGPHSRRQVRPDDGVIIAYTRFRYG
jgi:hypothetical protein